MSLSDCYILSLQSGPSLFVCLIAHGSVWLPNMAVATLQSGLTAPGLTVL